jgi:hypothetical protein
MLNGLVSVAGNVGLTVLLSRGLDLDPVIANVVAILACSAVNFAASDSIVFLSGVPALATLALLGAPAPAEAGGPGAATVSAWRAHEKAVDARYYAAAETGGPFFAQDLDATSPGAWWPAVRRGEISTRELDAPPAPDGRIHHWAGAVFIPGLSVREAIARLAGHAGRESDFYEDVVGSRLLERDGDRLRVFMKLRRTTIITATFNTEHAVEYRRLGRSRASSRSVATRIVELERAGTPQEREKAPGDDNGFLWRLNAYWRFEETGGGVVVECESVSLSRGVPALLRPVAGPIIDRVARESLERTLRGVRDFLIAADARHRLAD